MFNLKKILQSTGIDLEELTKQAGQVPDLLKALVKQSNTQNRALEHIIRNVDDIKAKVDAVEKTLDVWERLIEEDKKRKDPTSGGSSLKIKEDLLRKWRPGGGKN